MEIYLSLLLFFKSSLSNLYAFLRTKSVTKKQMNNGTNIKSRQDFNQGRLNEKPIP